MAFTLRLRAFRQRRGWLLVMMGAVVVACAPAPPSAPTATDTLPPVLPTASGLTRMPTASAMTPTLPPAIQPATPLIWIDPRIPPGWRTILLKRVDGAATARISFAPEDRPTAAVRISPGFGPTSKPLSTRVFALAGPFPTVTDDAPFAAVMSAWRGNPTATQIAPPTLSDLTLFMDAPTGADLSLVLGPPGPGARIIITDSERLPAAVWLAQPTALAVLPFDQLDPRWKLLTIDGVNLFERDAPLAHYPLVADVSAEGDAELIRALGPPETNRDPGRMAVVAMTGVTALVRGTAIRMDQYGQTWPGQRIRDWLRGADVAHVSNEVSFLEACPPPRWDEGTVFCSSPDRIALLQDVGVDVVELTGNHLWDYGWEALSTTLTSYSDLGFWVFGGGRTFTEALKPLTMTVNGNRIAFVGCNYFGANWATDTIPGSARCGRDSPYQFDLITPTIAALRAEGYQVIATLQYEERYEYTATLQQIWDFGLLRAAGAAVVNGSHGHHVQGFDVSAQGFIHYGTGNLFFGDQIGAGTHETFVDRHIFHAGRYLGADLRTAYIEHEAQPAPMKSSARAALLTKLFEVSGYKP